MSLALDHPVVETGDRNGQLEDWQLDNLSDSNTRRGRIYVKTTPESGQARVQLYRDALRTEEVATGLGPIDGRATFTAVNDSNIVGSVGINSIGAGSTIVLWVALASPKDLADRDRDITAFQLADHHDLWPVVRSTMRTFLIRIQEVFPPVPKTSATLRAYRSPTSRGSRGDVGDLILFLWSENRSGEFELVGLQNPGDWREWAIFDSLTKAWQQNTRGPEGAIGLQAEQYQIQAEREFRRPVARVDVDRDQSPEGPLRTGSFRLERG